MNDKMKEKLKTLKFFTFSILLIVFAFYNVDEEGKLFTNENFHVFHFSSFFVL